LRLTAPAKRLHAEPCPECGGELREEPPVLGLVENMLASFLSDADKAELERMVAVSCDECGYRGTRT